MVIFVFAFCPICVDSSGLRNHFILQKIHWLENMNPGLHWRKKSRIPKIRGSKWTNLSRESTVHFHWCLFNFRNSSFRESSQLSDIYALGAQGTWISLRVYGRSPALSIFRYLSLWLRGFLPTEHCSKSGLLAVCLTARPPRALALCQYSTLQSPPSCVAVPSSNWLISIPRLSTGYLRCPRSGCICGSEASTSSTTLLAPAKIVVHSAKSMNTWGDRHLPAGTATRSSRAPGWNIGLSSSIYYDIGNRGVLRRVYQASCEPELNGKWDQISIGRRLFAHSVGQMKPLGFL